MSKVEAVENKPIAITRHKGFAAVPKPELKHGELTIETKQQLLNEVRAYDRAIVDYLTKGFTISNIDRAIIPIAVNNCNISISKTGNVSVNTERGRYTNVSSDVITFYKDGREYNLEKDYLTVSYLDQGEWQGPLDSCHDADALLTAATTTQHVIDIMNAVKANRTYQTFDMEEAFSNEAIVYKAVHNA